jgi:hypothetical protein
MKSSRVSSLVVAVALLLVSCSSQSSTPTTTSSTVVQGAPVRTTVPSKPGAATKAWEKYVQSFVTIDVSEISKSDCGTYAMLVTEGSLTFYDWNGVQWTDISSLLMGGRGQFPLKVYSHDFTNDGVIDFFVTYGDNKARGGSTYGGFFASPTNHCATPRRVMPCILPQCVREGLPNNRITGQRALCIKHDF